MASSAIFLTIILPTIIASTSGFKIQLETTKSEKLSSTPFPAPRLIPQPSTDYRSQAIAGYPKVPPPNAHESGGNEFDLLPPFEDTRVKFDPRRSIDANVDPKTGYPFVAEPSWKFSGGDEETLELPLEDAVDPKTGYPLKAQPSWKDAGGDGEIIEPPLEDSEKEEVDPKTGYPLKANPSWKDAGGNGDILDLPLEDLKERSEAVDLKTKIIEPHLEDGEKEEVDPKTGYPLKANPSWKDAGGNGDILDLPLEDLKERSEDVDPKTGYPLVAKDSWKHAGGDGDILQLPLEEAVDPKTGYPLVAQPSWKDAGGNGDILELPLEETPTAVDPKTGYPLTAQPDWKDAGGDGDILQLPIDDTQEDDQVPVDPKTGYPLIAQPGWKDAGGDGDILQLPLPPEDALDPKTGYPLVAQPGWEDAGGNEDILELPLEQSVGGPEGRLHIFEIFRLTELRPPDLEEVFSSSGGALTQNQKRNSFDFNRPVESTYTYTGPENVVVTVTRFLSTDRQEKQGQQGQQDNGFSSSTQKSVNSNGNSGLPTNIPQTNRQTFSIFKRQTKQD